MRTMTGNFSMRGNDDRLQSQGIQTGVVFQLIDGFFEKRPRVGIANEQPPVLDLDIMVENGVSRGVHIGDKSVLIKGDRGQAHRIERGGWGSARSRCSCDRGNLDQAPGEGSENTLFLSAQVANFRIHVKITILDPESLSTGINF